MHNTVARNDSNAKAYLILLIIPILLAIPHRSRSQTGAPAAATAGKPPSQYVLYTQVFKHVAFLDYQAGVADGHGEDGNIFRNYYQARAGLTPSEAALLKSTAHAALAALEAVNQQIQTEVAIYRQQFHDGRWPHGQPLPKAPPEMRVLQAAKENAVLSRVAALQMGFGAARFQHFDGKRLANPH